MFILKIQFYYVKKNPTSQWGNSSIRLLYRQPYFFVFARHYLRSISTNNHNNGKYLNNEKKHLPIFSDRSQQFVHLLSLAINIVFKHSFYLFFMFFFCEFIIKLCHIIPKLNRNTILNVSLNNS